MPLRAPACTLDADTVTRAGVNIPSGFSPLSAPPLVCAPPRWRCCSSASLSIVSGDFEAAATHLHMFLSERPEDEEARLRFGQVLVHLGRLDEAALTLEVIAAQEQAPRGRREAEIRETAREILARIRAGRSAVAPRASVLGASRAHRARRERAMSRVALT